jgi:hypothetical protein
MHEKCNMTDNAQGIEIKVDPRPEGGWWVIMVCKRDLFPHSGRMHPTTIMLAPPFCLVCGQRLEGNPPPDEIAGVEVQPGTVPA